MFLAQGSRGTSGTGGPDLGNGKRLAVAAQDIPIGCVSAEVLEGPLDVASLFDDRSRAAVEVSRVAVVRGYLRRLEGGSWMKHVRLARDCHEQNLLINLGVDGRIRFEACRTIVRGEMLLAWFDRDLVERFRIPHLTPANIQGFQSYVCQECGHTFTDPNPLKIHLAFLCDRRVRDVHVPHSTLLNLPCPSPSSSTSSTLHVFQHPFCALPAIRAPPLPAPTPDQSPAPIQSPSKSASSGHRCCFCGKSYSRKYGLKIHIRTHTGYKPLRCKVCARPFGDPSNLNKHVRLHAEGDTPYRCDSCGKVLVRRRDLERHIKSRHPQNPPS